MHAQVIPVQSVVPCPPASQRCSDRHVSRRQPKGDRPSSPPVVRRTIWTLFGKKQHAHSSAPKPSTRNPKQLYRSHQSSLDAMERRLQQKLQLVHEGYKVRRIFMTNLMG